METSTSDESIPIEKPPKKRAKGPSGGVGPVNTGEPPAENAPMPGLIEGRMVHYVLATGACRGEHRAAIVSRVNDPVVGRVNLHVFLNGELEFGARKHPGNNWLCLDVAFSTVPQVEGTWHWMERA